MATGSKRLAARVESRCGVREWIDQPGDRADRTDRGAALQTARDRRLRTEESRRLDAGLRRRLPQPLANDHRAAHTALPPEIPGWLANSVRAGRLGHRSLHAGKLADDGRAGWNGRG